MNSERRGNEIGWICDEGYSCCSLIRLTAMECRAEQKSSGMSLPETEY